MSQFYAPDPSARPWQQQQQYAPPPPRNGFGIAGFALAIVGLVFCLMPITGFIGFILGLLAMLFALLGLGRVRHGRASNKKLTIVALVLAVLAVIAGFFAMKMFFDIFDGKSNSPPVVINEPSSSGNGSGTAPANQQVVAGQTVDRDGLQVTAAPLRKVKRQYGDPLVCSKVTYRNTGDEEAFFNVLDWKIQDSAGVQTLATYADKGGLSSGQLAPGGTVAGDVCITSPGTAGDYFIINEASLFGDPIRWATKL